MARRRAKLRSAGRFALVAALALGCTHPVQRRDWSDFDGPGAEHFRAEEIEPPSFPDPFEPVNRAVALANHGLVMWVMRPIGSVYRCVTPRFVRNRVRDFGANLLWPRHLVPICSRPAGAQPRPRRLASASTPAWESEASGIPPRAGGRSARGPRPSARSSAPGAGSRRVT